MKLLKIYFSKCVVQKNKFARTFEINVGIYSSFLPAKSVLATPLHLSTICWFLRDAELLLQIYMYHTSPAWLLCWIHPSTSAWLVCLIHPSNKVANPPLFAKLSIHSSTWRNVLSSDWRHSRRGGMTRSWLWFTNLWLRMMDRPCSAGRTEREPDRQLEDMAWLCSMPGQTHANTHLLCGLSTAGQAARESESSWNWGVFQEKTQREIRVTVWFWWYEQW